MILLIVGIFLILPIALIAIAAILGAILSPFVLGPHLYEEFRELVKSGGRKTATEEFFERNREALRKEKEAEGKETKHGH